MKEEPLLDFSSGYVQRAASTSSRGRGPFAPWKLYQNYALDRWTLRHGRMADGTMEFSRRRAPAA